MSNNKIEKKNLKDYKQSVPEQLELFQIESIQSKDDYSHTVEMYDIMPKYYFGSQKRIKSEQLEGLPNLNREFRNNDKEYKLTIAPASLNDEKTGKTVHYYPTQREELVEDAIRRLATQNRGLFLDDEAGVQFTLYEVAKELKRIGHGYSIAQIKQAIEVCSNVRIQITAKSGNEISATTAIFPFVGMESKKEGAERNRVVVMFHPLVTKSIKNGTYRLINYRKAMSYKIALSRWIHKRMSYNFTQASPKIPYPLLMSTIIRDSGMKSYSKSSENIRQICKSLDEMISLDVLERYEVEKRWNGRTIEEALFTLYVSESFKKDAIKASKIAQSQKIENSDIALDELRKEMEEDGYGLSRTVINGYLSKITTSDKLETISNALAAVKEYMLQLKKEGEDFTPARLTRKAIQEGWRPKIIKKQENNFYIEESRKDEEERRRELLKRIEVFKHQKWWKEFNQNLKLNFAEEDYNKWLCKLEPYSKTDKEIILSAPSKFLRDWIKREFFEKCEKSGQGIKDILCSQTGIDKIHIIYFEKS